MSVAVNSPSPFLPITSLQLQHFQAVTRSFAQRRPIISSVFSNFRTLSVATGGGTLPARFRGFRVGGFALSFVFTVLQIVSSFQNDSPCEGSFNLLALALDADERAIAAVFSSG
jgi:hypothetical protein